MTIESSVNRLGKQARAAARSLATADRGQKDAALLAMAQALQSNQAGLLRANKQDIEVAKEANIGAALIDRLSLSEQRIDAMTEGCRQVAALDDPVGSLSDMAFRPSGIQVGRMRVPLGVIGIIYESRPNVTIDAAALCLKSGNACILRGGSESIHSNQAILACISEGLAEAGLTEHAVQLIETTDRQAVSALIRADQYVDVIIPRGGKGLIERISEEATIPVIKHLDGICHVYIDEQADSDKAIAIAINAKTHRYGVCNAMETLIVHKQIAKSVLPQIFQCYMQEGVQIRVTQEILQADYLADIKNKLVLAEPCDWSTEYLAPIISVLLVDGLDEAIEHIDNYGSAHTDCIVTENIRRANTFVRQVDSSSVMVNASTRFADGFEYGLGAEIGISTDKLHARGPVGLQGLTSLKYVVMGDGHIRS